MIINGCSELIQELELLGDYVNDNKDIEGATKEELSCHLDDIMSIAEKMQDSLWNIRYELDTTIGENLVG